jgi:DNA polymerase-1
MEVLKEEARHQGYVKTLWGRRCYIPGIHDKNPALRGFAERQAINAPLQGTAADLIKRAMIQLETDLLPRFPEIKMLLQVHDELIFEVPESIDTKLISSIQQIMESVLRLSVPLKVDYGLATNWAQAHG